MLKDFIKKNPERKVFAEHEVKGLLEKMGLSVPKGIFVSGGEQFPEAHSLSYPLVAKVSSRTIQSKSDVGGVRTGIRDENELRIAFDELSSIGSADGVLVEETVSQGIEVIVGGVVDRQFGPVVMFGLGGLFVELFSDVAFALAPMTGKDALTLMKQVKGFKVLGGYRGRPPVDLHGLSNVIVAVSEIMGTGLIQEIDLNPVSVNRQGAVVLDAKLSLPA
ncbi:MAG: acetate--CoA ligase family protein [Nitrospirae bacterium]|nr:acetate--CoA ligase family protein [Nitrospirota bacterium]